MCVAGVAAYPSHVERLIALLCLLCLLPACTGPARPDEVADREPSVDRPEKRSVIEEDDALECTNIEQQIARARRGWVPRRSQDVSLIPREPNFIGFAANPVHTGPSDDLARVPLVMRGPGFIRAQGSVEGRVTLADVAPTIATLVGSRRFLRRDLDGDPLLDGLKRTNKRPRLVLTVVMDGAGWNVLKEHRKSWPYLRRLMSAGVSYRDAEIGSTPSNTPPIHTTIGTGVFPREHGIPSVKMRAEPEFIDPYLGNNADRVRVPTLADIFDAERKGRSKVGVVATVNWHLGMIGKGAHHPGGDRDLALLMDDRGRPFGDPSAYRLPRAAPASLALATRTLDAKDGSIDGRWRGEDLSDPANRYATPAYIAFQRKALQRTAVAEGFGRDRVPDLLYTNFKSIDDAGHRWGMTSREVATVLSANDRALRALVRKLDEHVGRRRWILIVTADHGQTPYPEESGAWPIAGGEVRKDANAALDDDDNRRLVTQVTSAGAFVDHAERKQNGISLLRIARWLADYRVGENLRPDESLPARWKGRKDERLFDAAVVRGGRAIVSCHKSGP